MNPADLSGPALVRADHNISDRSKTMPSRFEAESAADMDRARDMFSSIDRIFANAFGSTSPIVTGDDAAVNPDAAGAKQDRLGAAVLGIQS